jgi:hypothetical protein
MAELFRDWAVIVRKMKKLPTMTEYEHQSKYSVRPLTGRFKKWAQMPRGMHEYARQQKLDVELCGRNEHHSRALQGRTGVCMDVGKAGGFKGDGRV